MYWASGHFHKTPNPKTPKSDMRPWPVRSPAPRFSSGQGGLAALADHLAPFEYPLGRSLPPYAGLLSCAGLLLYDYKP